LYVTQPVFNELVDTHNFLLVVSNTISPPYKGVKAPLGSPAFDLFGEQYGLSNAATIALFATVAMTPLLIDTMKKP
jgi:hypothetical protein